MPGRELHNVTNYRLHNGEFACFQKEHACSIIHVVRDSFEDLEVNDETLTGADNQLVETFDLEYGGIYNSSEGSDSDFFTDSEL